MTDKKTVRMVTWAPTATGVMLAFEAATQGAPLKTSDDFDFAEECQRALRPPFRLTRGPVGEMRGDLAEEAFHEQLYALDCWQGITSPAPLLTFSPGAWRWLKDRIAATSCPPHMAGARRRTATSIAQASESDVEVGG